MCQNQHGDTCVGAHGHVQTACRALGTFGHTEVYVTQEAVAPRDWVCGVRLYPSAFLRPPAAHPPHPSHDWLPPGVLCEWGHSAMDPSSNFSNENLPSHLSFQEACLLAKE